MKTAICLICPLIMCAAQGALGCETQALELRQVSRDLTVFVTHRNKPLAGVKVQVVPEHGIEPLFSATTDENGTVFIRRLTTGRHYLTASRDEIEAGREWIEVLAVPSARTRKQLDFQWGDWSYETSRVAGTLTGFTPGNTGSKLMDIARPVETVYPDVDIMLKGVLTGDEYRTVSGSNGAFLISNVPDGTYVFTIAGGMKSVTAVAEATALVIDVKHSVSRTSLPLQLKDTGCYRTEFRLVEDEVAQTPLLKAIAEDDVGLVRMLLSKHIDVDERGNSALILAAGRGYPEGAQITKLLLEAGANPNLANSKGETPLISAEGFIYREPWGVCSHLITKDLLARGADPNAHSKTGATPLIAAAGQPNHDDPSFLQELIDAGADLNAADEDGQTALMVAAEKGHVVKVRLLLDNGANVNARDKSGKTALQYARPPKNNNDDESRSVMTL